MRAWAEHSRKIVGIFGLPFLSITAACQNAPTDAGNGDPSPAGLRIGSVLINTNTSGSVVDPDGYEIMVDGRAGPMIGVNDTTSLVDVSEGDHSIELQDVAANCSVAGTNLRTVSVEAGVTTAVTYVVTCAASAGSVVVTTSTTSTGSDLDLDPDGYEVWLDGTKTRNAAREGTVTLTGIEAGGHAIELRHVDSNCFVTGDNPVAVTVAEGVGTEVRFDVECAFVLREIVFVYNGNVVVMTAKGTSQRTLAAAASAVRGGGWTQPAWSPDGSRIVLGPELWCWFECDIELLDVAHGTVTKLTNSGFNDQPAWSPDGSKIAFTGKSGSNYTDQIIVMNSDGSNMAPLTNGPYTSGHPAWSPDGSKLAFTSNRDGNVEIYVTDTDGRHDWTRLTFDPEFDGDPDWSPDGSKIAFTSTRDGNSEVYVMNADGSNPVRLTFNSAWDGWPDWSSDGTRIAFNRSGNIWIMNADGSDQNALTEVRDGSFLAWPDWLP